LAILDGSACNILLTDWEMPGMDGLTLCRELRARDADQYTYMIILTGRHGKRDGLKGLGTGADDYLSKEASPEELLARMEVGRRITRLEQSLRESNEENRRLSETDPLTGARNHRFLMKHLPRELERSRRYLHPISILSCDLDDFKTINDRGGHEAGDQVLQAFVTRVMGCLRSSMDWIARSGGDEFVIVLPETGLAGARCVAEKIGRAVATPTITTIAGEFCLTLSIGATALESTRELTETSMVELLRAVDKCLYASKQLGRDRTTCAPIELAASAWASSAQAGYKVN
ncbi:MAG TPA: diguanylate cyclase, partial [Steroidobacteraceae bacterium]